MNSFYHSQPTFKICVIIRVYAGTQSLSGKEVHGWGEVERIETVVITSKSIINQPGRTPNILVTLKYQAKHIW
jgi:hypothetical protein